MALLRVSAVALVACGTVTLVACSAAGADPAAMPDPAAGAKPAAAISPDPTHPEGWKQLPAIATAVGAAAKADGVTIDSVDAWGEPANGCYAVWLALHGASGDAPALADQVLAGLSKLQVPRAGAAGPRSKEAASAPRSKEATSVADTARSKAAASGARSRDAMPVADTAGSKEAAPGARSKDAMPVADTAGSKEATPGARSKDAMPVADTAGSKQAAPAEAPGSKAAHVGSKDAALAAQAAGSKAAAPAQAARSSGGAVVGELAISELVKPAGRDGMMAFAFASPPFRGRVRARLGGGRIAAVACFGNERAPRACDATCAQVLEATP